MENPASIGYDCTSLVSTAISLCRFMFDEGPIMMYDTTLKGQPCMPVLCDTPYSQATLTTSVAGKQITKKITLIQEDMVGLRKAILQAFSLPSDSELVVSSYDDEDLASPSAPSAMLHQKWQ